MKKIISVVLLICICTITCIATTGATKIDVYPNRVNIVVNGQSLQEDNFLYNDITYVPLSVLAKALGATTQWDDSTKTTKVTSAEGSIIQSGIDAKYVDLMYVFTSMTLCADNYQSSEGMISSAEQNLIHDDITWAHTFISTAIDYTEFFEETITVHMKSTETNYASILPVQFYIAKYYIEKSYDSLYRACYNIIQAFKSYCNKDYSSYGDYLYRCMDLREECVSYANKAEIISTAYYSAIYYNTHSGVLDKEHIDNRFFYLLGENRTIYDSGHNEWLNAPSPEYPKPKYTVPPLPQQSTPTTTVPIVPVTPIIPQKPTNSNVVFPLHLYSNDGKTYLGKCITDEMDKDGIYYKYYGDYSSEYGQKSIWNKYGEYGGQYYDTSAFNERATKPPKIVDNNGTLIGYLTTNTKIDNGWSIEELRQYLVNNKQ